MCLLVALRLGVEQGNLVLDEVVLLEHHAVYRERLLVLRRLFELHVNVVALLLLALSRHTAFFVERGGRAQHLPCLLTLALSLGHLARQHMSAADGRPSLRQRRVGLIDLPLCRLQGLCRLVHALLHQCDAALALSLPLL